MRLPGIENHAAKLNDTDVQLIRYLYALGALRADLAFTFDISVQTIGRITTRKGWRHVPDLIPAPRR